MSEIRRPAPEAARPAFDDDGPQSRLDAAIDATVREMLAVEPRADLRARVMAHLPASSSQLPASGSLSSFVADGFGSSRVADGFIGSRVAYGFSRNRVVFAAAAAAAIIVAVLVMRRPEPLPQAPVASRGVDQHLPAEVAPEIPPAQAVAARATPRRERLVVAHVSPAEERGRIAAAAADGGEDVNFSNVGGLSAPPMLEIARLQPPAAVVLPSFAPQPMTIRALEVTALPQTPRERREE